MCNSWCLPWYISVEHSCIVIDGIQVHVYWCGYLLQDEFMSFIVMFMDCALHVKNPYLRAKMVEVLKVVFWRWYSHPSFWAVLFSVQCD
jgi:ubiquitin conjugation factor E4 B